MDEEDFQDFQDFQESTGSTGSKETRKTLTGYAYEIALEEGSEFTINDILIDYYKDRLGLMPTPWNTQQAARVIWPRWGGQVKVDDNAKDDAIKQIKIQAKDDAIKQFKIQFKEYCIGTFEVKHKPLIIAFPQKVGLGKAGEIAYDNLEDELKRSYLKDVIGQHQDPTDGAANFRKGMWEKMQVIENIEVRTFIPFNIRYPDEGFKEEPTEIKYTDPVDVSTLTKSGVHVHEMLKGKLDRMIEADYLNSLSDDIEYLDIGAATENVDTDFEPHYETDVLAYIYAFSLLNTEPNIAFVYRLALYADNNQARNEYITGEAGISDPIVRALYEIVDGARKAPKLNDTINIKLRLEPPGNVLGKQPMRLEDITTQSHLDELEALSKQMDWLLILLNDDLDITEVYNGNSETFNKYIKTHMTNMKVVIVTSEFQVVIYYDATAMDTTVTA